MTTPLRARPSAGRSVSQHGAVLVVSLVLLAVMLVLGLASMRLVLNEERMTGQTFDRALAFQAAEAALREAEQGVEAVRPTPAGAACEDSAAGMVTVRACPPPASNATPRWQSIVAADWATASPVASGGLTLTPDVLVEYLGSTFPCGPDPADPVTCKRYRITASAGGGDGRAAVMVQSVYATD
jgi:type IV pilus assembly protein PilX